MCKIHRTRILAAASNGVSGRPAEYDHLNTSEKAVLELFAACDRTTRALLVEKRPEYSRLLSG